MNAQINQNMMCLFPTPPPDVVYRSVCGWVLAHVVYALLLFPARLVRPLLGPLRGLLPILDATNRTIMAVTAFTDQEDVTSGLPYSLSLSLSLSVSVSVFEKLPLYSSES